MRENSSRIKIFKNFKEKKTFKPEFGAEGIFGGHLLGVRASNSLSFYDWESLDLIRRIEITVKHVSDISGREGDNGPCVYLGTQNMSVTLVVERVVHVCTWGLRTCQ